MDTQEEYKKFDVESMYQFYLRKMGLSELFMSPSQRIERKRAWMSGFAMAIRILLEDTPDTQEEFDECTKRMMDDIVTYLKKSIEEVDEIINEKGCKNG